MATHKRAHDKPNSAQRMESDYSEDFEEEEVVGSAAIPSSKPSARSLSVQRRSLEGMARRRRKEIPRPSVQTYGTPNRRLAAASQSTTKSKSTGAIARSRADDTKSSRRVQSFRPRKLQPAKLANSSPARDRQLSAVNHTVHSLQNKLAEKSKQLQEMKKENCLLNRLQRRQDREWTRIQRQEDELPQLLQRHEQEVRALRKQLKKSHEEVMVGQQKVGELQDELQRLSDANRKLEKLAGKKKLLERDCLTEQVQQLTRTLADRDKRISELERGLEASGKSHAQEIRGLRLRNRALASETTTLRETAGKLHSQLMEKTKEMDVLNIYTQRIPRNTVKPSPPSPPPSLPQPPPPSPPPLPAVTHQSSQTTISCPPFKTVSMQHRSQMRAAASQTDMVSSSESVDTATQTVDNVSLRAPDQLTTPRATVNVGVKTAVESVGVPTKPHSGESGVEEQRSKQMLLQRLRELDGQKTAPSSNPMPAVQTSGTTTAPPPAVAITHTHHAHTAPVPAEIKPSVSQSEAADVCERERKQLLLAKLMAIDEGNDPNHAKPTPQNSQRHASSRVQEVSNSPHGIAANQSSTCSLSPWPEVIENMHNGRPAHASENDPFGSRSRLSSLKRGGRGGRGVGSAKEEGGISAELFPKPVPGRWEMEGEKTPPNQQLGRKDDHYKPSFGRRAHTNSDQPQSDSHPLQPSLTPAGEKKSPDPHSLPPSVTTSRGGLLSRRPKADATAMRSHDVMPGAVISEPDDLEELVL